MTCTRVDLMLEANEIVYGIVNQGAGTAQGRSGPAVGIGGIKSLLGTLTKKHGRKQLAYVARRSAMDIRITKERGSMKPAWCLLFGLIFFICEAAVDGRVQKSRQDRLRPENAPQYRKKIRFKYRARAPVLAGHEENTLGSVQPSLEYRSISINIHPTNNRPGPAVLLVASAAHTKRKKATRRPMGRANSPDR